MATIERIATLDNEMQAQWPHAVLTERGIPHVMKSYHDSVYDGLFQGPRGWGQVEAPAEFRTEILSVLEDLARSGESAEDTNASQTGTDE